MEINYLIKLLVLAGLAVLYFVFRQSQIKADKKTKAIIDRHKTKRSPIWQPPEWTQQEKEDQFVYLNQLVHLLISPIEAKGILNTITNRNKQRDQHNNYWHISHELVCQEVIDYQIEHNIYMYGYFDVKSPSTELNRFITEAIKTKYHLDVDFQKSIDLDQYKFIHDAFEHFEEVLQPYGISLRNIDMNTDSYTIILVKTEQLPEVETLIEKMRLKLHRVQP
ncbi:DUF6630 family protein [Winogradskyella tangerina]|uniref:DUF6630 family protein n=1 Tax=Winogradskyella tangerina TaxID=2023240 RepID=UPI000DBE3081|nr:hypothetical protein [Winogradskyella tangerina]